MIWEALPIASSFERLEFALGSKLPRGKSTIHTCTLVYTFLVTFGICFSPQFAQCLCSVLAPIASNSGQPVDNLSISHNSGQMSDWLDPLGDARHEMLREIGARACPLLGASEGIDRGQREAPRDDEEAPGRRATDWRDPRFRFPPRVWECRPSQGIFRRTPP